MARRGRIIVCVVCATALLPVVAVLMARVPVPDEYRKLRLGDSVAEAQAKVPTLRPDLKDGGMRTWFIAPVEVVHFGIVFRWHVDVTFDADGHLRRVEGHSYNDVFGLLDSEFDL